MITRYALFDPVTFPTQCSLFFFIRDLELFATESSVLHIPGCGDRVMGHIVGKIAGKDSGSWHTRLLAAPPLPY